MASSKESEESEAFHWHFPELEDIHFEIHGKTLYYFIALFIVVLLLSLLVIYWRWFRRCHRDNPTVTSHAPTPPRPQPRGLDPAAIRALPVTLVTNAAVPETDCSICLVKFEDGDKVKVLPQCQHLYHSECVDQWLSTESSCPLCRSSIQIDSDLPQIITQ
ncbi:hypothetical protein SLEP1_g58412 [Rubroshorea leprosula]|uniref:RING-type E3 ubiquitin transferase n=1 Tax=Rubroshorea leprosula TaxID=152421 RepID=A0AAV5MTA5_9ROSI|nr:hypothetical protein SLEP1_g58412 [Rubroshorea leprosula]